ncbi:MAG: alpha-galactosidase [Cyclobacteriaceae bacterium]|nr:alpha-galactosidase [Cyclobacteriaceae bacterium]
MSFNFKSIFPFLNLSFAILIGTEALAQPKENQVQISNSVIQRNINFSAEKSICTSSLKLLASEHEFTNATSDEFYFTVNEVPVSGKNGWELKDVTDVEIDLGSGKIITLQGAEDLNKTIQLKITYLLYPDLPIIRKRLEIINLSKTEINIENVAIERLALNYGTTHSWIYKNYARQKHLGPYTGDWDDPLVVVHDIETSVGLALGNESPGVLKRTDVFTSGNQFDIGLSHDDDDYPFRKWIKPGESWTSPFTFVGVYENANDPTAFLNQELNEFVRKHIDSRISKINHIPAFVYNTWRPFQNNINDSIVYSTATKAAQCGYEEFVIDAGWYTTYGISDEHTSWADRCGDWIIDSTKFEYGLKPVFDSISSLGMKPGLWISLTSAHPNSLIFRQHPEYFVKDKNGDYTNLHSPGHAISTACFGTGWYDYIKGVISGYVKDYDLKYVKLDLSIVTSAYIDDPTHSGCYAEDHPHHKDWQESFWVLYERCFKLFDELHAIEPDIFIDCTFETAGKLQLIDYALIQRAEGDWLSNIEHPEPLGSFRARNLAWWKSAVIPASSLAIGNLSLNDSLYELSIKSMAGSLPLLLGNPIDFEDGKVDRIHQWATWLKDMQSTYDFLSYRQDLPGFGEPTEGQWDGFVRINTDTKSGGIIGVFKQESHEDKRVVKVNDLEKDKQYEILKAPMGELIGTMSGEDLSQEGFEVEIKKSSDGELFELRLID